MQSDRATIGSLALALAVTSCLAAYTWSTWPHSFHIWKMHVVHEHTLSALFARGHRASQQLSARHLPAR